MFRKTLIEFLAHEPRSASWLARELGLKRGDVEHALQHALRSARAAGHRVEIVPARCKACDFVFSEEKLVKPGRCPACRGTRLFEPMFRIERKDEGAPERGPTQRETSGMLGMTTVHHVAVCVTDLARAEHFYGAVLGFTPIDRPVFRVPGTWYELPDGSQLHLIQHSGTRTLRGTTDIDLADGHFAIRVSDFDAAVAHLRAHGVEVLELQQNPTAWKQVYFTDPDGNVIELNAER